MRDLLGRITVIDRQMAELAATREPIAAELSRLQWITSSGPIVAPYEPPREPPDVHAPRVERVEWTSDRVRTVLLWVGAALLAASALTFTAVAWSRLGDGGRALLLGAVTAAFAAVAVAMRTRLPASAEAFTALSIGLLLIDWHALRRAGIASGLATSTWWALGALVVGVAAFGLGVVTRTRSGRVAAALLVPAGLGLMIITTASAAWSVGLGFALLAAVLRVRVAEDIPVRQVLQVHAVACWIVASIAAAVTAVVTDSFGESLTPVVVIASLALAPLVSLRRGVDEGHAQVLMAIIAGVAIGVLVAVGDAVLGPRGLLAWATFVAGAAVLAARVVPARWRAPLVVAAIAFGLPGLAWAVAHGLGAAAGPLNWFGDAWSGSLGMTARLFFAGEDTPETFDAGWPAVWALVAAIVPITLLARGTRQRMVALACAAVLAVLAVGLVPVVAGMSARATLVIGIAVLAGVGALMILGDRRRVPTVGVLIPAAAVAALPVAGWAALTRGASIITLLIALALAATAALLATTTTFRTGARTATALLGIALAGVWTAAIAGQGPAGFVVVVASGLVLLVGARLRARMPDGYALEVSACISGTAGLMVSAWSIVWLGGAFTALVPVFVIASLRRERTTVYGITACAAALAATWTWLAVADVTLVEAYTMPAAALAVVAGLLGRQRGPARSWITLAPGLAIALGPTLAIAIANDDITRTIAAAVLAFGYVLFGARQRLQAPLVLGAIALLVLAIDTLGPVAARLPEWVPLAVIGVLMMWVGVTFERRRLSARRAADHLLQFG
jgi:hypothetical protein